jgi:predicted O-methyltransferase YrrM
LGAIGRLERKMCEECTIVTQEHFRYLGARTLSEDQFLRELKDAAEVAGIPTIWIAPEQASFMQIMLKLCRAREVVEVGTLAGYSAIAMARALPPGGRVRTIEIEENHADFAERWIAKSDVADRIEVYRGAGADVLPTFEVDSADAAFIDADKEGYCLYLDECLRIVRRGGVIMADNAFAFGRLFDEQPDRDDVAPIREFNDYMAGQKSLHSIIAPIGDGCWVGVKL